MPQGYAIGWKTPIIRTAIHGNGRKPKKIGGRPGKTETTMICGYKINIALP